MSSNIAKVIHEPSTKEMTL